MKLAQEPLACHQRSRLLAEIDRPYTDVQSCVQCNWWGASHKLFFNNGRLCNVYTFATMKFSVKCLFTFGSDSSHYLLSENVTTVELC